ncbi:MAG: hypothetical protein NC099_03465 [Corallococcus sp.]|nr:hypothetical protein [Corallococcus sp.]
MATALLISAFGGLNSDENGNLGAVLALVIVIVPVGIGASVISFIVSAIGLTVGLVKKLRLNVFAIVGIGTVVILVAVFVSVYALGASAS